MKIFVAGATCAVGLPLVRPLGTLGHALCTLGHQVTGMTRAVQFGQARPAYCVTMLISLSPFDELIRSSCTAHISLRNDEKGYAMRTRDTIYIDGALITPHGGNERRCSIPRPRNRSGAAGSTIVEMTMADFRG
jgi:hypothetical protein